MKHVISLSIAACLASALCAAASAAPDAAPARVAGEKIDSGLGELPHYSLWADPSGKTPMRSRATPDTAKQAVTYTLRDAKPVRRVTAQVAQTE